MTLHKLLMSLALLISLSCWAQEERLLYVADDQGYVNIYDINNGSWKFNSTMGSR